MTLHFTGIAAATFLICGLPGAAGAQTTPAKPTAVASPIPSTPPPAAKIVSQKAQLFFPAFTDAQFQSSQATGRPSVLVFGQLGHPVWLKQAPVLQVIMRSADRVDADVFQIDITDQAVCEKFKVTAPGTVLVMKDNMERLRGNGMIREAAIKKFLRLIPTL